MLSSKCARMRCSNCASSSTSLWLRPPAGSSSISSFGPPISARASSTRFCVPNGRPPACVAATSFRFQQIEQVVQPRDSDGVLLAHHRQPKRIGDEARAPEMMRADQYIVPHAHPAEQCDILEGAAEAQAGHAMAAEVLQRATLEQDVAVGVAVEAADAVEQRGLAGTVRPDQAAYLRHSRHRTKRRQGRSLRRSAWLPWKPGAKEFRLTPDGIRSRARAVRQSDRRRDGLPYVTPCAGPRCRGLRCELDAGARTSQPGPDLRPLHNLV